VPKFSAIAAAVVAGRLGIAALGIAALAGAIRLAESGLQEVGSPSS
jgi:hypothetical protein